MAEELKKWEYRVQTIGGTFGTKDEDLEETLNAWGEQGWEATQIHTFSSRGGKVTIVAKRPLTRETVRMRSMPKS
jgi:hypothetical protein